MPIRLATPRTGRRARCRCDLPVSTRAYHFRETEAPSGPDGIVPIPTSINPAQGYLANWNNKPSVDYDNADTQVFGKQFRNWELIDRLATGTISVEDMRDIPKEVFQEQLHE
jgi:hypothetical protein